jgi:hypothetical protein
MAAVICDLMNNYYEPLQSLMTEFFASTLVRLAMNAIYALIIICSALSARRRQFSWYSCRLMKAKETPATK